MASRFWVGGTGTWDASTTTNWSATSGGAGGQSVPGASDTVTFDASSGGGVVTVGTGYNPSVTSITMGAFTGTLDFSAFNNSPTMQTFDCSGTGVRTLTMGSGTWTLTGNNATIWNTGTATNLTMNSGTSTVVANYSGSTGTRTFSNGTGATTFYNISITAGSDIVIHATNGPTITNLNYTGFTGSISSTNSINVLGNLTFGAGMTVPDGSGGLNINGTSGIQTLTTNGVLLNQITKTGVGGTLLLADNLTFNATRSLNLTSGSINANNFNVTTFSFNSSNSNTRTLTMGSGTWQLTGTGTVWNTATTTGLTLNANTSTVKITDSSASSKTITSGVTSLYNLWLTGGGSGDMIIGTTTGTSTFNNIAVDPILTVKVFAGKTIVAGSLSISGYISNVNIFKSTTDTSAWSISVASGTVSADYISLRDSTATGGATFYAGANSTNVSGNTGWTFTADPNTGRSLGKNTISNAIVV
jgi:hypothetical protein